MRYYILATQKIINHGRQREVATMTEDKKTSQGIRKIAYIVLIGLIFILTFNLAQHQAKLNNVSRDLKNIEYLNAGSQRLVKLVALEHGVGMSNTYLSESFHSFLTPTDKDSLKVLQDKDTLKLAQEVLENWKLVERLVLEKETNTSDLYLASDNLYYKMTDLMVTADSQSTHIQEKVFTIEVTIGLLFICLCVLILRDMLSVRTELNLNKSLMALASVDSATGIYNRSKCQEILKSTSNAPKKKSAIIVFDLNDLKKTNDTFGHKAGDSLIYTFAYALQQAATIHTEKPFVGRYGGDEFIIQYDGIEHEDELKHLLKELHHIVGKINEKENKFQISFAMGYAINEEGNPLSSRELFEQADEKMYLNKEYMKSCIANTDQNNIEPINDGTCTEIDSLHQQFLNKMSSEEEIKQRISKEQQKNGTVVFVCAAIAFTIISVFATLNEVQKSYIGGNVFYLADSSTLAPEDKRVSSPWKNASSVSNLMFETLFLTDYTFTTVEPALASAYRVLDEGYTYEITLNNSLYWSDGQKLTLDDVVFSLESFLLCTGVNSSQSAAISKIQGALEFQNGMSDTLEGLTVEENVLTIKLSSPYNNFMAMMTQFAPFPKHILENVDPATFTSPIDYFANPVCSGMYKIGGFTDDGNLYLEQNPYYSGLSPKIEIVELVSGYSPTEIDYYNTNVVSEMVDYRAIQGFTEYPVELHFYRYFVYNLEGSALTEELSPMSDIRVRQALVYALDRKSLLEDVYFNTGSLFYSGSLLNPKGEIYSYNPVKAVELLNEAGYDFTRPIKIGYYYTDTVSRIFLEKVESFYNNIGLTVELYRIAGSEQIYAERDYDLLLKGLASFNEEDWYNEYLTSNTNMSQLFGKEGIFDHMVYQLGATNSRSKKDEILDELVALEKSLLYKMSLFTLNQSVYINENRINIPDDMIFANTWYKYDKKFAEWEVIKE